MFDYWENDMEAKIDAFIETLQMADSQIIA